MEWIETTGTSVDEAKERALDRLGVAEDELEYEVLAEPTSAFFGLRRTDARLRARVRPVRPRLREERRDRGRRRGQKGSSNKTGGSHAGGSKGVKRDSDHSSSQRDNSGKETTAGKSSDSGPSAGRSRRRRGSEGGVQGDRSGRTATEQTKKRDTARPDQDRRRGSREGVETDDNGRLAEREGREVLQMDLKTQARITEDFVRGLLEKMGLEARVVSSIDEDRALVEAQGLNLGLAIGPRGGTVRAITQLARTMIQRMSDGDAEGSLTVDIGGYRERRRSFLLEFATIQAEEVRADGRSRALEPMNAADRKVIHDAVAEISGVTTQSEGLDMDRRVVIHVDNLG